MDTTASPADLPCLVEVAFSENLGEPCAVFCVGPCLLDMLGGFKLRASLMLCSESPDLRFRCSQQLLLRGVGNTVLEAR